MMLKVLLADDHKIVRDGLRALLARSTDIEVVGETENGRTTVLLARQLEPDIIIMDVAMPDLNGIEATRQILSDRPATKVVAVSMHSDRRFVSEMLKAGAAAYLSKDYAFDELGKAIQAVSSGKIYLSPDISGVVVENYVRRTPEAESSAYSLLSVREREVLQLLAEGRSAKEIAEELHVSIKTVETHRSNIMTKLDIHNIAELTKYAIREGLTPL